MLSCTKIINMQTNYFSPAHPTHPMQDKFGGIIAHFGLSKIEYATMLIAQGLAVELSGKVLPETIADEAFQIAMSVLDKCDEELKKLIATQNSVIDVATK